MLGYVVALVCVAGAFAGDCQVKWSDWSACDAPCGPGRQQRWGEVIHPGNSGRPCPPLEEFRPCNLGSCNPDVDCVYDSSDWTPCDKACKGTQFRWINVVQHPLGNGRACPYPLEQSRSCNDNALACNPDVDCVYESSDWTPCDKACKGTQYRWINVIQQPLGNGRACPYPLEQSQSCNVNAFACNPDVDCVYESSDWTPCDKACKGTQYRWINVIQQPLGNGRACPYPLEQSQSCNVNAFACNPDVDCAFSWGPWSACDASCGQGYQSRSPQIISQPLGRGRACPLPETRSCSTGVPCSRDCVYESSDWTACDRACQGTQFRWINILQQPFGNGKACPSPLEQSRSCNVNALACNPPVDCVEQMGPWSACSNVCGLGQQSRSMQVVTPAQNGGRQCTFRSESRECKSFLDCPFSSRSGGLF